MQSSRSIPQHRAMLPFMSVARMGRTTAPSTGSMRIQSLHHSPWLLWMDTVSSQQYFCFVDFLIIELIQHRLFNHLRLPHPSSIIHPFRRPVPRCPCIAAIPRSPLPTQAKSPLHHPTVLHHSQVIWSGRCASLVFVAPLQTAGGRLPFQLITSF